MRLLRILGMFVCVVALAAMAVAADNMGIRDAYQVKFVEPVRVGGSLLPAGEYVVRHTMEGADHVMVFEPARGKAPAIKAKCQLIQLGQKAEQTRTVYAVNDAKERVLQELVFRGDTAKHVF